MPFYTVGVLLLLLAAANYSIIPTSLDDSVKQLDTMGQTEEMLQDMNKQSVQADGTGSAARGSTKALNDSQDMEINRDEVEPNSSEKRSK